MEGISELPLVTEKDPQPRASKTMGTSVLQPQETGPAHKLNDPGSRLLIIPQDLQ